MTMALIGANGRLILRISHKGLWPIVINNGMIGFKITSITLDWPDTHI